MTKRKGTDRLAWGVDVGGTDCKVGVVDADGRVRAVTEFETPASPETAVREIERACTALAAEVGAGIDRLGLGVPGPLDLERGVIVQAPNLGWRDVPLRDMVADALGCPVVMDNDANAAAFGEAWVGAGRGARVLLLVTLGTGVGGGVVEDGRVFHGARGLAVEIGHMVAVAGGRACSCGKRGCVEAYFSAHALREQAAEIGVGDGDPRGHRSLFERYAAGDRRIVPWLGHAIDVLAQGVAHAGVLFDPDRIVFTGGLTHSWDLYRDRLLDGLQGDLGPAGPPPGGIGLTELGGRAGVVGAAGLAMKE
ncbi:MAG TPA: ROK family protein [Gemmatimonadota bacterium]|nr:ROK family protein [Gemmatimonadota bacterium]